MTKKTRWLEFLLILGVIAVGIVVLRGENVEATPDPVPMGSPKPDTKPDVTFSFDYSPLQGDQPLLPLEGKDGVPKLTQVATVLVKTDAGDFTLELYPEAAPNAVERFLQLVEVGFYNDTSVSRVVEGFVAQFGVNPSMKAWKDKNFDDDPSYYQLERGTIAFAKAGRNTNSTQVFINFSENNRLAEPSMNFTTFGKVTEGMETVDAFKRIGDPSGGLDQTRLWNDPNYLASLTEKPTMILSMERIDLIR